MREMLNITAEMVWRKLGSCVFCMRKAFLAMTIAWLGVVVASEFVQSKTLVGASYVLALGLTGLWLGHVYAYAQKHSATKGENTHVLWARRNLLVGVAKAALLGSIGVFAPSLLRAASAQPESSSDYAEALKSVERDENGNIIVLSPYGFKIREIGGKKYVVSKTQDEFIKDRKAIGFRVALPFSFGCAADSLCAGICSAVNCKGGGCSFQKYGSMGGCDCLCVHGH